ncbi:MAG: hypothetical protein K6F35_08845, partial [Lachnospiraceae bacterium]|nr:hypothetical protein [Lachnospiraceae bacterium]
MKQRTHGQGMLAVLLSAVMVLSGVAPAFAQEAPAREETAFETARETAESLPAGETSQAQPESGLQPENDPRPDAILIPDPVTQMPEEADDPEKEETEPGFRQEEPEPVGTVELNGTASMNSEFKIYEFATGDPAEDQQVTDGILDLSKKYYATSSYTAWKQHYSLCMIPEGTEITPELVPVTKKDSMTPYPDGLMEIYCGRNHHDGGVIYYSNTSNYTNGVVGDGFRLEYLRGHGYTRPKAGGGVESPQYTQVLPGTYRFLIYNDSTVYYSAPYTVTDTGGLSSVLGTVNAKFYDVKNADGTYGVRDSRLKGSRDSLTWLSSRSSKFYLDLSGFTQQLGRPLNSKTDSIHLAYGYISELYDSSDDWGTWTTIWPLNSARAGESSEAKYPALVDDSANNRQVIEGIELKTRDQGCNYSPMQDGYSYRVVVVLDEYKENNKVYIDNKTFQFIDQADGIRITTSVLPPARLGEAYEAEFEAVPMKAGAKITWSLLDQNEDGTESRIPDGLVFDVSRTDTASLSGTPSSVENTRFTIQAEEEGGKKHKREYSITFRNEIVVYVTGLGEKEAASLYCRPDAEAPEGRNYIGTVRNGRNYFDTSLMRALKGQYFFIDRNAAFGIVSDGMVQLTGEDRSLNISASPMKGYSLVFQDEEGKSLPGGILASLKVKDGNYCAAGNDGIYRVPEGQSISSLDLIATLDTRDPDLVREYKLEG